MALVSLEDAKSYLRVDSDFDDNLISSLLLTSEALCTDVARLTTTEWGVIGAYPEDGSETVIIRDEVKSRGEILQMKELLRIGTLYTLGYLYEHREEADHHGLAMTLRNLLFAIREGVF